MANTRGVFTLQDVRYAQEDDVWVSPEQSFFAGGSTPNVGYVAGGSTPSTVSSVDKMSLADDTTAQAPSANLSAVNRSLMGLGNGSNAYWCGGRYGGPAAFYSGVEKLSYFSDTVSRSPASNLPATQADASGTSNEFGGYIAGGSTPTNVTTVNKLIFATDTCFRFPSANLISAENGAGAVGNQSNCYIGGGETPINSTVDKIVFATDTTTRISANVASLRSVAGASGDSAGYFGGGNDGGPVSTRFKSTVVKFTFSDDTTSTLPSANSLRNSMSATQGVANSSAGYFAGGSGSPSPSHFSNATKISFSNDTASNVPSGGNLSATRYSGASASARASNFPTTGYFGNTQNLKGSPTANIGYVIQGSIPGNVGTSYLHKLDYSTDALGVVPSGNLTASKYHNKTRTSPTAAYTSGGIPGSPVSTTNKTTYSSETSAGVPSAATTTAAWGSAASSNTNNGFNYGGISPGPAVTTVDKINFAGDTLARIPSANLPQEGRLFQATGNPSRAYLGGGGPAAGTISSFDRMFYSNETTSRVPSANFPGERRSMSASGNNESGYYSGFATPGPQQSTTSKLNYATDTVTDLPAAPLSSARAYGAGTGSRSFGYQFSGYISPTRYTLTERLNYANDTFVQIPSANFPVPIYAMAGASVKDNDYPQKLPETPTLDVSYTQITTPFTGYTAGGGGPGGRTSNYYKLLYATETGSFLPSTNLTSARSNYLGGYSDTTKGYTQGGYFGSPFFVAESWVDRVTYSTDTSVTVPGAYLPSPGRYGGTTGSSPSAGYYVAGYNTGALSTTLKMPFSSEVHALAPGASLSSARYYFCGGGGPDKGYFGGGYPATTNMDKLIYSTDTMTASPSTNLFGASDSTTRGAGAIVGNSRDAYLATGQNPGSPAPVPNYGYKINYSTDTSRIINGFVARPRQSVAGAFGHELEGYFCGGIVPSPYETVTTVDKITYATEVSQLVPSASMPEDRGGGSSMSARNFGASGGGTSNIL